MPPMMLALPIPVMAMPSRAAAAVDGVIPYAGALMSVSAPPNAGGSGALLLADV